MQKDKNTKEETPTRSHPSNQAASCTILSVVWSTVADVLSLSFSMRAKICSARIKVEVSLIKLRQKNNMERFWKRSLVMLGHLDERGV